MRKTPFGISIYNACSTDFFYAIHLLVAQLDRNRPIIRITFFGNATDDTYEERLNTIQKVLTFIFTTNCPLMSFVVQPVQNNGDIAAEVMYANTNSEVSCLCTNTSSETPYVIIENEHSKTIVIEGVRSQDFTNPIALQSKEIFSKITSIFGKEGFQPSDIVRQWNYIGNITATDGGIQHYQAFNEERARFFATADWQQHGYPAATGIGMSIDGLLVSIIAVAVKTNELRIIPIDNPLQVAAHQYSQSQLIGHALPNYATPKFERAKIILDKQCGLCFISGTAAIRGEESMHSMNAELQTLQTIENINYLVSDDNLKRYGINNFVITFVALRVYLKKADDLDSIQSVVEKFWPEVSVIYTVADICRQELLVEIEGVATIRF
jgi:enamine deaminase RidA (YjgF/YER057c/UK114 family)